MEKIRSYIPFTQGRLFYNHLHTGSWSLSIEWAPAVRAVTLQDTQQRQWGKGQQDRHAEHADTDAHKTHGRVREKTPSKGWRTLSRAGGQKKHRKL